MRPLTQNSKNTCDVLVIGGGGAGLAAAIEARSTGAHTILIEKNPELGGTTAWSIGSFTATGTPQQQKAGIEDSTDAHFADMPKFAGPDADRDNPGLRRLFVDNANDTLRWLMSMGVEFFGPMPEPPHTKPRIRTPKSQKSIKTVTGSPASPGPGPTARSRFPPGPWFLPAATMLPMRISKRNTFPRPSRASTP